MSSETNENNSAESGNEKIVIELEEAIHSLASQLKAPIVSIRGFLGYIERDLNNGKIDSAIADITRIGSAANEMEEWIHDEWEEFIGLDEESKRATRSAWALGDGDSRVRVRVKMLITKWRNTHYNET